MKVELTKESAKFKPIAITLTIESKEEAEAIAAFFGSFSLNDIKNKIGAITAANILSNEVLGRIYRIMRDLGYE
jgi:hypothetical protein